MGKHRNNRAVQTALGPRHVVYVLITVALMVLSLIAIEIFG